MKFFLVLMILLVSCTSLEKEYNIHLRNGLKTYPYSNKVNLNFLSGFSIKELAFIKKNKDETMLVIKLNKNIKSSEVEKYSLAIKSFFSKQSSDCVLKNKEYISTPIKPSLLIVNGHNYIVTPYNLNVKCVDKIEFFLYDRDKFRKVLSKPIFVKKINQ